MNDIKFFFKTLFAVTITGILTIFGLMVFFAFIKLGGNWADYRLDQSYCTAKVNNQVVYNGRCHYLDIESIDKNGNTKHLTVYGNKWKSRPVKQFINNNITVEEYSKGGTNAR